MRKLLAAAVFLLLCATLRAENWKDDEFTLISGPASPRVLLGVKREGGALFVAVEPAVLSNSNAHVELGVSAAKKVILNEKDLKTLSIKDQTRYIFSIPETSLVSTEADWDKFRLALAVAWDGGPQGQDRWRERFRHRGGASHLGLSPNEGEWLPFSLTEHALALQDKRNQIAIPFEQPLDGKASIVIEDEQGRRVRNLIAGVPLAKGTQRIVWDGLDEQGRVVPPGNYAWRAISHPGVKPEYQFSFCNDGTPPWRTGSGTDMWGPDHSVISAAAANKEFTFFGGSVAESGYAMVAVDAQGIKRMQYNPIMGTGIASVALAADDTYLYAAHDGFAWTQKIDRSKPDWKASRSITITRFDIKSGKVAEYSKGRRFLTVSSSDVGPGSEHKDWLTVSLNGLTYLNGKLYVSAFNEGHVISVDTVTGEKAGEFALEAPGALSTDGTALFAVSAKKIVKLDGAGKVLSTVVALDSLDPQGLAVDKSGRIMVSDGATHTVKIFDATGKEAGNLGTPGGPYAGAYDVQRMIRPRALAVASNGWVWVTENRGAPKRVSAWDPATGKCVATKFGPTAYGASGAGFDTADPTRWIGQGGLWKLDIDAKRAECVALLKQEGGVGHADHNADLASHYSFVHVDNRTFVIGMGGVTTVSELKADNTLKDVAIIGSTHRYAFSMNWKPPQVLVDAYNTAYPAKKDKFSEKGSGFLWVDQNGDGEIQADEVEFATSCENFAGAYWGHDFHDLTLKVPATIKGKRVLVTLKPDGYLPSGAPKYPKLNEACATGTPVDLAGNEVETTIDRFGNTICNTDPEMKAFAPDGKLLWTFPNKWSGVHGSHAAPLPENGVMQGTLFFLGMTPLDDKSDVFVMNGNHGRFFVLTSDGLYLDEMFKDVRMGGALDAYLIGGECFGGFFGKAATTGQYYLQSGHTDYRIFKLNGLDQVKRSNGSVQVTADQAMAAERGLANRMAKVAAPKDGVIKRLKTPPVIDGKQNDWAESVPVKWEKSGRYPVTALLGYDDANLYLHYEVSDSSPWINTGKDWTLLFKTGDSIDLQLGLDPSASSTRSQPAPGDIRLLIAPFQGKDIAVLYRHRIKGAKENPVTFVSPWRSEVVDSVKQLSNAKIAVVKEGGKYRVEAAIPLADLGMEAPAGKTFKADLGVLYGDDAGAVTLLRSYWSNQNTNLVNDVPGEIMLSPNLWGVLRAEGGK